MEKIVKTIKKELDGIEVKVVSENYARLSAKKDIGYQDIAKCIKMSGINFIPPTDEKEGFLWFEDGRKMTIAISLDIIFRNKNRITMSFR
ncbi:hypothetical protein K8R61_02480 [bacterium]|nr:hypothetical protein [bacterium]